MSGPARLGASLAEFVGHPAYGAAQLRQDLEPEFDSHKEGREITRIPL